MTRVLVVEDTADIAAGIAEHLSLSGCDVRIAPNGTSGLEAVKAWDPDVIILDLMLPDISGYDVLQRLRLGGAATPVLILSARNDEMAKVRGFRDGADDYVTKPFSLRELSARVQVLSRRATHMRAAPGELRFGSIVIQRAARRVLRDDIEIYMRPKEFDLLMTLIERVNQVMSRKALLAAVWAYEPGVESRTVDWHVAELRRKLGDSATAPHLVETVRKSGYRWIGGSGIAGA